MPHRHRYMPQILLLLLLSVKRRRRYINREKARNLTTIFDGVIPSHGAGAVAEERGCGHRQVSSVASKFWEDMCIIFTVSTKLRAAQLRAAAERSSTDCLKSAHLVARWRRHFWLFFCHFPEKINGRKL